ncbi:DEAD-box ATP-dependent RNA helicase CshA [Aquisphaera giovannonii]|uniref:DEAD-box ATP-dependent RNA helicase CshA n=1 Tax=Aquisphaera giovannonii TaxID=406548 RepID=A0A5B9VZ32_9BACT|nr:DEAD/DEAH box helicase [Aquisphaera giovannonii]QEH33241.1 DEAD-box ATP-dependent RNA helicase CshA [Aquisphaera giovannonii]
MGLSATMLKALARARYVKPSPIQSEFIPLALDGLDVLGQAKTGTGKTAAFGIPLIEMMEARSRGPQAIILAPTRELVQQIVGELQKLAEGRDVAICGIYGGEPIERQLRALARGVDIVVGTPGRVMDHMERRTLYLGDIVHVVLDEADRMLDIGFRPDIERILRKVPDPHQTMLLSATISDDVRKLAGRYMYHPVEVNLSTDEPSVESIQQYYISVNHDRKVELLVHLLKRDKPRQCIVFTRTKRGADRLAERLRRVIPGVASIHGDLAQSARDRVMRGFRDKSIPVLVATDVVGRGIDVEGISHVINYDIPDDPENYVHRIGRTGRMGKDGIAYLFVGPDQGEPLTLIENLINKVIPSHKVEGFEVARARSAAPAARELYNNVGGLPREMAVR